VTRLQGDVEFLLINKLLFSKINNAVPVQERQHGGKNGIIKIIIIIMVFSSILSLSDKHEINVEEIYVYAYMLPVSLVA